MREGGDGFDIAKDGAVFLNELGKVFLTEDFIGGGATGKVNLGGVDEGVGGGGELPGAPGLGVDEGLVEEVIEPVAAVGGADEEGRTFFIGKGGAEDFGPDFGLLEGAFIEDDQVQTFPAEVIEDFRGADRDQTAGGEEDGLFGFEDADGRVAGANLGEGAPTGFGGFVGGGDPPGDAAGGGFADALEDAKAGFAPTATGGKDFEAMGILMDFILTRMGGDVNLEWHGNRG